MGLPTLIRWLVIAISVAALEVACRSGAIPLATLIAPSAMVGSLAAILWGGDYTSDILRSFGEIAAAAALAVVIGFIIGVCLHAVPPLRRAVEPLLASYYAIPTFMLYPVFIILFGVGSPAIIAVSVLLAVVAMISATLTALDRVPPVLRRTARTLRMGRLATVWRVILPAALPHMFAGVKLAVAYAFIGVIASEFILSGAGLGYAIAYAYNNFENRTMYGLMLLVVLVVASVNGALGAVDRRLRR